MNRMIAALLLLPLVAARPAPRAAVHFAKPFLIGGHFANGPRLPMAADFDADGFADFACAYTPGGGIVDVSVSVRGQKMRSHCAPARAFGADVATCAAGEFVDPKGADIALLLADGQVKFVHGFDGAAMKTTDAVARVEAGSMLCRADLDGDGRDDLVCAHPSGRWVLLLQRDGRWDRLDTEGEPAIRAMTRSSHGIAFVDRDGGLGVGRLEAGRWLFRTLLAGTGAKFASGDFDGDRKLDLVYDGQVLPGGDPAAAFACPAVAALPDPSILAGADLTGDGADDLVCFRKDGDILLLISYRDGAADPDADGLPSEEEKKIGSDPLDRDTDGDGLLDGWEVRGFAGIDLGTEGFSPVRKDVLCYLQRMWDVDAKHIADSMRKTQEYFATLGIGFHAKFLPPLDPSKHHGRPWWELGNENLPRESWGLAHYMVVGRGGGGQAAQMGTMGGCGDGGMPAVFIHEFGHQLGLGHTGGFAPAWCPLYRSLMNYDFTYAAGAGYSRGRFASVTLIETELVERLPFKHEELAYLAKHPFRFKIQADGEGTLVDWNRNGAFEKEKVCADINASYSTDGGERVNLGKTIFSPCVAAVGDDAWVISVSPEGNLESRKCEGDRRWSAPTSLGPANAVADPFAIGHEGKVRILVPTKEGIRADGETIPDTIGFEVSAAVYQKRLLVILWSPKDKGVAIAEKKNGVWTRSALALKSEFAPGAVEDTITGELIFGVGTNQDGNRPSRWQIVRCRPDFTEVGRRWVGGEKEGWRGNRRPVLFFETGLNAGPEGRIHFVATGWVNDKTPACFYDAMTIGDRGHDDGWLLKRYYDEWTNSLSPVTGAWHKGDLVIAHRWGGDQLMVAHRGLGIQTEPMGDFDDVGFIAANLNRSILWMAPAK